MRTEVDFETLKGETLAGIAGAEKSSDRISFLTKSGRFFQMRHYRECCERVDVEDIIGDPADLIDSPLLMAEEVMESGVTEWGTSTWTFYKLATIKGYVTIRWYGESNGYYSETVSFEEIIEND